jgi:hypothetical protein
MTRFAPTRLLFGVGLVLLSVTVWQVDRTARFLSGATRTMGVVVASTPHPRISFSTPDGRSISFIQNGFISRPAGAAVPVAYEARDPAGTAVAATFWTLWGTALWMLPAGLGFTIFPLFGGFFVWGNR